MTMAEGNSGNLGPVNLLCQCFGINQTVDHERQEINPGHRSGQVGANVANWTNRHDLRSQWKRSDIFHEIVQNQRTEQLRTILEAGWDVNEILEKTGQLYFTTSLHEASRQGWTEGVKMLLDAGAKYMTPGTLETPLQLAIQNCSVDIVDLLLKHGADPKSSKRDSLCLGEAIMGWAYNDTYIKIIHLLLENGADPNISVKLDRGWIDHLQSPMAMYYRYKATLCPILVVLALLEHLASRLLGEVRSGPVNVEKMKELRKANAEMFKTLVNFGADVNWKMHETEPELFHRLTLSGVKIYVTDHSVHRNAVMFLQEHLDIFYQNGGNINVEYGAQGTALEYTLRIYGLSNSVRWMIRHGAAIVPHMVTLLDEHFSPECWFGARLTQQDEEIPLILLQAGMRVSHRTQTHLINIANAISSWKEQSLVDRDIRNSLPFRDAVKATWATLVKECKEDIQRLENKVQKHVFPEYLSTQMADLEEFSDESLHMYPEAIPERWKTKDILTFALEQIYQVLTFLDQPQSMQWYCRRCIRENLVSLQPSVVKILPVPGRLKRYILCHEL